MFMHPDQLRGGTRGLPEYEPQTTMPSLWPGGWWRVRDIVEKQKIAAWATVDLAARNRETVLWNMYLKATRQTERGATQPVKAYAIAAEQHDPLTVKKLVNMLLDSGVEVHQAKAQFIADGRVYGPGSFVVSMAQPKQGLVRWMLGRTFYPDNTYTRDREGNPIRPYDMSTDTFGEFMGVRSDPIGEKITADLVKLTAHVPMMGTVAASAPNGYVLDGRLNDSFRAAFLLLDKGIACAAPRSRRRRQRQGRRLPRRPPATWRPSRQQTGVDFVALKAPVTSGAYDVRKPRIAMYQRYGGGNMDEGWTRLMFEQFNVPFKSIMDAEIKAGGLEAKYDTIILPADSCRDDRRAASRRAAAAAAAAAASAAAPTTRRPSSAAASAPTASRRCRRSCRRAARCSRFAQAGDLPIQRFGLPLRNIVAGLPAKTVLVAGIDAAVKFDNSNPLAYGMPREGLALFMAGGQVYEVTSTDRSQDVEILVDLRRARHPAERLAARRAGDCEEGRGGVGEARRGQGRADRLPPAAPRPDARHVQAGVQRAAQRAVERRAPTTTTAANKKQ